MQIVVNNANTMQLVAGNGKIKFCFLTLFKRFFQNNFNPWMVGLRMEVTNTEGWKVHSDKEWQSNRIGKVEGLTCIWHAGNHKFLLYFTLIIDHKSFLQSLDLRFRILSTVLQLATINWENIDKNTYFTPGLEILIYLRKGILEKLLRRSRIKKICYVL